MPILVRIDETGIAIITCSGVLRLEEAQTSAATLWEAPGWAGKAAVWDFRGAEFDVSPSDTRRIARFILEHQPKPPPSKMAFVTQRDSDFGMSRMFEVFREHPDTAFRVFRDYDDAIGWVRSLEPVKNG